MVHICWYSYKCRRLWIAKDTYLIAPWGSTVRLLYLTTFCSSWKYWPFAKLVRYPDGSTLGSNGTWGAYGASRQDVKYWLVRCIPRKSPHLSIIEHSSNLPAGTCLSYKPCTSIRLWMPLSKVGIPNPVSVMLCHKKWTRFDSKLAYLIDKSIIQVIKLYNSWNFLHKRGEIMFPYDSLEGNNDLLQLCRINELLIFFGMNDVPSVSRWVRLINAIGSPPVWSLQDTQHLVASTEDKMTYLRKFCELDSCSPILWSLNSDLFEPCTWWSWSCCE